MKRTCGNCGFYKERLCGVAIQNGFPESHDICKFFSAIVWRCEICGQPTPSPQNLDGSWVSYDAASDSIIDVDVFNFEGKNLIYKIPAAPHTIHAGDMIVHQGKGMYVVADVCEGDTCVSVIDPRAGESKEILFCKNMFGFNYVTKLVSVLNGFGSFTDFSPSSEDPFGNMWMLALLNNENEDLSSSILPLMLMNQFNPSANTDKNNFNMNNPLMWILLSNKK